MSNPEVLEKVDIFSDLSMDQLVKISRLCREIVYFHNELIFAENSPSTEFYVILEGEVAIQINPDLVSSESDQGQHESATIAILYPGQSFGEVALVDQGLRSASAICNTMTCKTLVISRQDFMNLLKQDPEMGYKVMTNLASELCLKIRITNFNMRQAMLYVPKQSLS